jgi:GNAT superfamily N-acetyltransferase
VEDRTLTVLVERSQAGAAARFAIALAAQDSSWKSETRPLSGGHLVLCGAGLYVNRALAAGFDDPLDDADLELLEARSAAVGVPPSVEVTSATHPATIKTLTAHGYAQVTDADVTVHVQSLDAADPVLVGALSDLQRVVVTPTALDAWMEVSAQGWGHASPVARQAADAFARAAHVTGEQMLMAVDAADGRPLGCASLRIDGTIATLGGMSTIPEERGRGVQAALIHHRLRLARQAGCTWATSSARSGGPSERNLARHGFEPLTSKLTYIRC